MFRLNNFQPHRQEANAIIGKYHHSLERWCQHRCRNQKEVEADLGLRTTCREVGQVAEGSFLGLYRWLHPRRSSAAMNRASVLPRCYLDGPVPCRTTVGRPAQPTWSTMDGGAKVVFSRNTGKHMKRRIQKNMSHKHQIYLKLTSLFKHINWIKITNPTNSAPFRYKTQDCERKTHTQR